MVSNFFISIRSVFFSRYFLLITIYFLLVPTAISQTNFEPVSNSIYSYLERMSQKGIIQTNEEILPFSRKYIAEKLKKIVFRIQNSEFNISEIEKEELEFYIREFAVELERLGFDVDNYEAKNKFIDLKNDNFGFDKYNRFRLFSYSDSIFSLYADPILSYSFSQIANENTKLWSNGIKLYGSFGKNVAFDLQFYDNHFRGNKQFFNRSFSPLTGFGFNAPISSGYDFDRMNANLTFSWNWGSFSLGKDFNYYGSGENGKLILSDKAPSFPFIKLEVAPANWLKFSYIHGLLNSQVLDSSTFRYNPYRDHISTVDKYFVTHILSITPFNYLNFSLGESVVYSDKFQPIYLIPVIFFRFAEHYFTDYAFSDPNVSAGNAQIFSSIWYKNYWLRTKFYGSIFIDELSTRNSKLPQAIGYNFGIKSIDPIIPESELILEYSRINPFVYFHVDKAQTYANYGYEMGHWIGSNADQIYLSFKKRIIRGLNFNLYYSVVRKGSEESFDELRYQDYQTFLWGEKNQVIEYGCNLSYEIMHNFNLKFDYKNMNEKLNKKLLLYEGNLIAFSIGYGL